MRKLFILSEFNRLFINDIIIYLIPIIGVTIWNFSNSKIVFYTSTFSIGFILFSKVSGFLIDKFKSDKVPLLSYYFYLFIIGLFVLLILHRDNSDYLVFLTICSMSFIACLLEINSSVFIPDHFFRNLTGINSKIQFIRSLVNFLSPILAFTLSENILISLSIIISLLLLNCYLYTFKINKVDKIRKYNTKCNKTKNISLSAFTYIIRNKQLLLIVIVTMGINFFFNYPYQYYCNLPN